MEMEVVNLFPTPVGRFHLGLLSEVEAKHLQAVGSEQVKNVGNTTSKARRLLQDPALPDLRTKIDEALAGYVANILAPARKTRMLVTQGWLNVTTKGQFHHKHAHPGSLISGVYYVEAAGETDRIMFHRSSYRRIQFPPRQFNPWNSETWWIPVKSGDLILFPSELEHSVPDLQTDTKRVSLAFNTWFQGECGSQDDLTHLQLSLAGPYAEVAP
jgi:uncharacterized protein (TIGR02466 family)